VELADLVQESFFSLLDAVEVYDPKSGFSFLTYTNFPLKNRFAAATRMLTPAQRKEPLSRAMSLDKPLPNAEDLTLADVTEDHSAAETKWHSL
ncbi:MAG: hypothetical protein LBL26_14820, partial [Peptococcaceae bacterium]|nr:hypothetical protein [Peptococcaceae bacterium]